MLHEFHAKRTDYFFKFALTLYLVSLEELEAILAALKVQTDVAPAVGGVDEIVRVHLLPLAHVVVGALALEEDLERGTVRVVLELVRRADHVADVAVAQAVARAFERRVFETVKFVLLAIERIVRVLVVETVVACHRFIPD